MNTLILITAGIIIVVLSVLVFRAHKKAVAAQKTIEGQRDQIMALYRRKPAQTPQAEKDEKQRIRVEKFLQKANDEYARMSKEMNTENLSQDKRDRYHGSMRTLIDSVSAVTGEDSIIVSFQMPKAARERRNEEFPMNSCFSGSPMYMSNAYKD